MTDTMSTHSAEELQHIAAQAATQASEAQAELERRAAERAAAEDAAAIARARRIIDQHMTLDEQLAVRAGEYSAAFTQAVQARDLPAAFTAWVEERATREARRHIRSAAQAAEQRAQTGRRILPDLSYYDADLLARLQQAGDTAASDLGQEIAAALIEKEES